MPAAARSISGRVIKIKFKVVVAAVVRALVRALTLAEVRAVEAALVTERDTMGRVAPMGRRARPPALRTVAKAEAQKVAEGSEIAQERA